MTKVVLALVLLLATTPALAAKTVFFPWFPRNTATAVPFAKDYGWQSSDAVRVIPNDYWFNHTWRANAVRGATPVFDASLPTANMYMAKDPQHLHQWHLGDNYLNMERAWAISKGTDNVVIVVSDDEIDLRHPDLSSRAWRNTQELLGTSGIDDDGNGLNDDVSGWNFSSMNGQTYVEFDSSVDAHGTTMSSILGASTNNEPWANFTAPNGTSRIGGIAGITWGCPIIPIDNIAATVANQNYMAEYVVWLKNVKGIPIRVVSMSWVEQNAYVAALFRENDILGVIGAGNNNSNVCNTGGSYEGLLSVSAVRKDYARYQGSQGSSYGASVDLVTYSGYDTSIYADTGLSGAGWNEAIWYPVAGQVNAPMFTNVYIDKTDGQTLDKNLTFPGNYTGMVTGTRAYGILPQGAFTSGATAQTSGVAALIFSKYPDLTAWQVRSMLLRGCANVDRFNTDDCGGGSCAGLQGAGRLDAYRAMTLWGAIGDTVLSGDVYISGDVWVKSGATVTCEPGTNLYIAPDDIYEGSIKYGATDSDADCKSWFRINYSTLNNVPADGGSPIVDILVSGSLDVSDATIIPWSNSGTPWDNFSVQTGGSLVE
jgi:hypothetical protein